jgi:predicted small secreted protein
VAGQIIPLRGHAASCAQARNRPLCSAKNIKKQTIVINPSQKALFLATAFALAACNTTGGDQPGPAAGTTGSTATTAAAPDNTPAQPMTRTQAASECWMKAEKLEGDKKNIDSRLSYVEKCINDKTKTAQPAAPKT